MIEAKFFEGILLVEAEFLLIYGLSS